MKKAKRKSSVKRRRVVRNSAVVQPLSFDPPSGDDMPRQTKSLPKRRMRDSIDRVIAECDKVDAALFEITQNQEMPPLTIRELDVGEGGAERGWAVVSADPQRPLTEKQAKEIVAAMQPPGLVARMTIAAE
jgi:hypothetical protein